MTPDRENDGHRNRDPDDGQGCTQCRAQTLDTEFSVDVRCVTNHRFTLLSQLPTGPSTSSFVRIRPSR